MIETFPELLGLSFGGGKAFLKNEADIVVLMGTCPLAGAPENNSISTSVVSDKKASALAIVEM